MPRYLLVHQIVGSTAARVRRNPSPSRARVQILGERFRQPIGQRLHHDRVVVVVVALVARDELVGADARGDRERAEVVGDAAVDAAR